VQSGTIILGKYKKGFCMSLTTEIRFNAVAKQAESANSSSINQSSQDKDTSKAADPAKGAMGPRKVVWTPEREEAYKQSEQFFLMRGF
jgi:hypothetical protein